MTPSIRLSPRTLGALAFGVSILAGVVWSVSRDRVDPGDEQSVAAIREVSAFAGAEPARCVFASPGLQICSWPLAGRLFGTDDPGETTLALNLICELAIDVDDGRRPECRVHSLGALVEALPAVSAESPSQARARVLDRISEATTVVALSHSLGELPTRCQTAAGEQRCEWTNPGDVGTARLRCELPLDGSPRLADSCELIEVAPDLS